MAGSPRARRGLVVVAACLLVAIAAEAWWWRQASTPEPTAGRPVVLGPVETSAAVRSVASSTRLILSYGFEDLDAQLEDAATRMTPEYAESFRSRVLAGADRLQEQRATQEARLVDAGVVSAGRDEVTALVFVDRVVAAAGAGTTTSRERLVVTGVRRNGVWLVSDIRTR